MMKMKLSVLLFLFCEASPLLAYRDGARENSCYDHSIEHGDNTDTFPCNVNTCRYFLRIKEVVNEATLQLGNETGTYQCGRIYGIELANNLNDPEGFLIQARNGTEVTSEIIGTFLDPDDVRARSSATQINYKILSCNRSMESMEPLLPNSATHPMTVDNADILQLYWQAPDCSTCGLGNVDLRIWFTVVQQLQTVFVPSKVTVLQLENYVEPEDCVPTTAPPTTTSPPTTTMPTSPPTTTMPQRPTLPPTTTMPQRPTLPPTTTMPQRPTLPPTTTMPQRPTSTSEIRNMPNPNNPPTARAEQPSSKCGILFLLHFLSVLLIFG